MSQLSYAMNTTNDQAKYNQLFHAVKEMRKQQTWFKEHGGEQARQKMIRLQQQVDSLLKLEIEERKRAE